MMNKSPRVSVVDDDESVRESLPDLLKAFGFTTQAFSSAEEFLASENIGRTKCLILDIAMAGITGLDLHRELKTRAHMIPTSSSLLSKTKLCAREPSNKEPQISCRNHSALNTALGIR
jgi:DNA-binding NtrC family response regulator